MKKAQISLEYISIITIALTLIALLSSSFFYFSNTQKNKLDNLQINEIGNSIITNSEEIYFRGSGNKIQLKIQFPEIIENMSIVRTTSNSINVTYLNISQYGGEGTIESLFLPSESYIYINCSDCTHSGNISYYSRDQFSQGPKTLSIKSIGEQVLIDFIR